MLALIAVHSQEQITEVALLAHEIWHEHYLPIIGRQQIDYMLEKFQSEDAIATQIAKGYQYFTATWNQKPVGYIVIVPNPQDSSCLLSKLYVKSSARGLGAGKAMLQCAEDFCRGVQITKLWLTVNKKNVNSMAWYSRMGFLKTGSVIQDIGGGFVMDDFRFEKVLP
ncbi:MAG TPA: GNAT family N-acetyltransferase [Candidatus Dormibacteraeota bacterium]|nr:GNAT family N-acetyltransferase [Candidatus Dormibacteraeota bacterium]